MRVPTIATPEVAMTMIRVLNFDSNLLSMALS